jgi:hypothetical protein
VIKKTHSEPNDASVVLGELTMRAGWSKCLPLSNAESAMSEVEYDGLLDTVRAAVAAAPPEPTFNPPANVANDNRLALAVGALPEGRYGAG